MAHGASVDFINIYAIFVRMKQLINSLLMHYDACQLASAGLKASSRLCFAQRQRSGCHKQASVAPARSGQSGSLPGDAQKKGLTLR
jgi:hypothetical protein